ncbi:uncharacterized protein LOC110858596 isoform X2 [Folsomia candida]|nr:uncharacterized protein LOC110858596 isoform X2 [Folsomia candida]
MRTDHLVCPTENAPDDAVPGETFLERRRRRQRAKVKKSRQEKMASRTLEVRTNENAPKRVIARIDRALDTLDERGIRAEVKNLKAEWEKMKLNHSKLDPEVEDDLSWKEFMLLKIRMNFENERKILCEELLELELGPHVPTLPGVVRAPNDNDNMDNPSSSTGTTNEAEKEVVRNRWKGALNPDEDAIMNCFNQVQIKIEAEERDEGGGDDETTDNRQYQTEVTDWIARVITDEQGGNRNKAGQSDEKGTEEVTRSAKSQAIDKFQDIVNAPSKEARDNMLSDWEQRAMQSANEYKLEKLQNQFLLSRNRWISEKPDDGEKRTQADKDRNILMETINKAKRRNLQEISKELVHKREMFSQETLAARKARIENFYKGISSYIKQYNQQKEAVKKLTEEEKQEKRKQKLILSKDLTKAELNAINAANAKLRIKMERAEYEMNIDLLEATGLPIPKAKFGKRKGRTKDKKDAEKLNSTANVPGEGNISIDKFESAFRTENYYKGIDYWISVNVSVNVRVEVRSYRNVLFELLSARRKIVSPTGQITDSIQLSSTKNVGDVTKSILANELPQYEWIPISEEQSLQDIRRFVDFMTKFGDAVKEHLSFKRFYTLTKLKDYSYKNLHDSPILYEERRIEQNERLRRSYIKKKYGVILGKGEYFDKKTMSAVKKPPKKYLAYERKRAEEGTHPNPTCNENSENAGKEIPEIGSAKSPTTASKGTRVHVARKPKPRQKKATPPPRSLSPRITRSQRSRKTIGTTTVTPPCYSNEIEVEYSNSSNGFADSGDAHDHQDDSGWVPLGSCEIDSVIRNDILNLPNNNGGTQQQQNSFNFAHFQSAQHGSFPTLQGIPQQLRTGNIPQQTSISYANFSQPQNQHQNPFNLYQNMPQLQLVDQFTNQMTNQQNSQIQWNPNIQMQQGISQPLNYSVQFLPNSQINMLQYQQHASSSQSNQQSYDWSHAQSSTMTNQISGEMPHLQAQFPIRATDDDHDAVSAPPSPICTYTDESSSEEECPPPQQRRSQKKVIEVKPKLSSKLTTSEHYSTTKTPKKEPNSSKNLSPSTQQKKRGRPKGWTKTKLERNTSSTFIPGQRRDIWNNYKRRKFYNTPYRDMEPPPPPTITAPPPMESPFERNPEQIRDSILTEIYPTLLPKCPQCDKVLDGDAALKSHVAAEHPPAPPATQDDTAANTRKRPATPIPKLDCPDPKCTCQVEGVDNLVQHIFCVHFEAKQYKCPFKHPSKTVSFSKGRPIACDSYKFERNSLRNHINRQHYDVLKTSWVMGIHRPKAIADKVDFWCLHCQQCYKTYSDLMDHYKSTHEIIRYCCVYCGIYLRMEDFWMDHVKLFHPDKPFRSPPNPIEVNNEDLFRCAECDSEFSAQNFLDEHKTQGHTLLHDESDDNSVKNKLFFLCRACDKKFQTEELRDNHFKSCKDRNHICYWCKYKATSEDAVELHIKEFHPQEPPVPENREDNCTYSHEPYKCELCKRSYYSLYSLRLHWIHNHQLYKYLQNVKVQNPPQENASETAEQEIEEKPKLAQANAQRSEQATGITCPMCQATNLDVHQTHKTFDKLMRRYCVPCDRLFSRTNVLSQHNEATHGILPHQTTRPLPSGRRGSPDVNATDCIPCTCGTNFTIQEFHTHHLFIKRDNDIRICQICDKKFFSHVNYLTHIHKDHGVPKNEKMVVMRGKTLPTVPRELVPEDYEKLSSTTKLQTANGETTISTCKVCLKNFKTLEFLHAHIADAHKEDAFTRVACTKCNCTFTTKNNLSKHDRFHHRENLTRLKCPVCKKLFQRMDHLRDHSRKAHPRDLWAVGDVEEILLEKVLETVPNSFICKICSSSFKTDDGLKSHMTNKHFPTHFSTFCEHCGLQMNPKFINTHIEQYHFNKSIREIRKKKDRVCLTLTEVVEMIQTIYNQHGVQTSADFEPAKKSRQRKKKKWPKWRIMAAHWRKISSARKKKEHSCSEEEDEETNLSSSSSEDDDADIFSSSDEDKGDNIDEDCAVYGEGSEGDSGEDKLSSAMSNPDRPDLCTKKRLRSMRPRKSTMKETESESDSVEESYKNPGSSRRQPKRKKTKVDDHNKKPLDKALKSTRAGEQRLVQSNCGENDDCSNNSTRNNRKSAPPKSIQTRKLNLIAPRSMRRPTTVQPTLPASKELILSLERCDELVRTLEELYSRKLFPQKSAKTFKSPQRPPTTFEDKIYPEVDLDLVKDEIVDEIFNGESDDISDDINKLNMFGLSEQPNKWKFVNIPTQEEDDDSFNPPQDDPFSGIGNF